MVRFDATPEHATLIADADEVELRLPDGRSVFGRIRKRERIPEHVLREIGDAMEAAEQSGRDPRSLMTTQDVFAKLRADHPK